MQINPEEFKQKPLRAHALLADVPLHDVWKVDLPGGGAGRTLNDLQRLVKFSDLEQSNPIVDGLFRLRWLLGRWFGWDAKKHDSPVASYIHRLTLADRERSLVEPGGQDGPFRVVYRFENESLGEIVNGTVHAFALTALEPSTNGYTLYLAVYVKQVNRFTPFYMMLIDPFRRLFVYPAMIQRMKTAWASAYA
jgi:hypothetical protein